MPQNTIDSLDLVISADTSRATKSIVALVGKLRGLRNTFKELNSVRGGIRPLVNGLKDIAKIDFSGAEKSLANLADILKLIDAKKLAQIQEGLDAMATGNASSVSSAIEKKDQDKAFLGQFNAEYQNVRNAFLQMNGDNFEQVVQKANEFALKMEEAVRKYGQKFVSVHNKALALQNQITAKVNKTYMKEDSGGSGMLKGFGKRVINRAIFSIVRLVIQAVKDLIKQLIADFAQVDKTFNGVISEAWSSIKYLKGAIKASFAPVFQLFAPIITMLAKVLGNALNEVAKFTAMIAGQDYYYKATYAVEDYAESLETAKNSLTASFDKLNILNSGVENDLNYEKVEIESNNSLKSIVSLLTSFEPLLETIASVLLVSPVQALLSVLEALETPITLLASLTETISDFLQTLLLSTLYLLTGKSDQIGALWQKFGSDFIGIWEEFGNGVLKDMKDDLDNIYGWLLEYRQRQATGLANVGGTSTGDKIWKNIAGVLTGGVGTLIWGTGFATGGFPEDGLFMANHNELVGKFANGKTAVANNEQITNGIYRAVLQAMNESGGNGREIVVAIDGREVARAVNKANNNSGDEVLYGGNLNYGK